MKHLLLTVLAFFLAWSFVGVVSGNPIPWEPPWEGSLIQYFSIIAAEFCGLLAGVAVLVRNPQIRWQKATITVSTALIISYAYGLIIWTLGYSAGFFMYNSISPFFIFFTSPLGLIVLLLPEFIGTASGTVVIQRLQKINWKTAFKAMTAAMLTSFLLGWLIAITFIYMA